MVRRIGRSVYYVPSGACSGVLAVVFCSRCLSASWARKWWPFLSGIVYATCVSGDWRVWACRIPAWAATMWPARLFSWWPKCVLALAVLGFLRCIPITRAFGWLKRPTFALRCGPSGCGAGWTSKHPPCSTSRALMARPGCWPMVRCSISRMRKS